MWRIIILIITTMLLKTLKSHESHNSPDVFVKYSGHAEALDEGKTFAIQNITKTIVELTTKKVTTQIPRQTETADVVFIPNERDHGYNENVPDDGVMLKDVMNRDFDKITETESPSKNILFISGKNNENIDEPRKSERRDHSTHNKKELQEVEIIDCKHLNCNNTVKTVCGGKLERKQWKYRLFLNECYYRKVNCAFNYDYNRYKKVSKDKCKNVGAHYAERPYERIYYRPETEKRINKTAVGGRRNFASRRSLNQYVDGAGCSHSCPISCLEDYDPQCAVSSLGHMKVFLNHCKLDYDSCLHGIVWHIRPLSNCVGGKKADIQQNRAFIGWMQKVGIVDNKGRLVLS